jgi:hypothetical protein
MSNNEKRHVSRLTLGLAERASRNQIGRGLAKIVAGSSSRSYLQGEWYSELSLRGMSTDVRKTVTVPGDPTAGKLPRNWRNAMVMAATDEALQKLYEETEDSSSHWFDREHAVAYIADDIVHVGIAPQYILHRKVAEYHNLFRRMEPAGGSKSERAVAMRIGQAPLEATMGLWLPDDRHFVGVETLRVVTDSVSMDQFSPHDHTPVI